jgi:Fur family transcriptional regulator, zinc uptake regulator
LKQRTSPSTNPETTKAQDYNHNHERCVQDALAKAAQLCRQRTVQLTPIRQQILALIWADHKAVKAYDLLDLIKPLQSGAKPATVYRALDFLIEQGLIHRVESLNAFIGCTCPDHQHEQLLLICTHCNEVEERSAPKVMQSLTAEVKQADFIAKNKAIEIHGICNKCAKL